MRSYRTGIVLAALVLLPAALPLQPAAAAASVQKNEANLVLLEVRLGTQVLSDAVTGYELGRDVYLPLGEMARLLTLAIRVTPGEGRASGYILTEERNFSLDVQERAVDIAGLREAFDPSQVRVEGDDIYVASRLLARWLPVDLDLDMSSLALTVRPREQLPLQARLARRERGSLPGTPAAISIPAIRAWPRPTAWPTCPSSTRRSGLRLTSAAAGANRRRSIPVT